MDTLALIVFACMIILSLVLIIATIKSNYFVSKVFKNKNSGISQNDNLRYIEGNMGNTGMPNLDSENHYENSISAPLEPKKK